MRYAHIYIYTNVLLLFDLLLIVNFIADIKVASDSIVYRLEDSLVQMINQLMPKHEGNLKYYELIIVVIINSDIID
jgi:hypothetical protein